MSEFDMMYSDHCKEFLDEKIARLIYDKLGSEALSEVCAAIDDAYQSGYDWGYDDGYNDGYSDAEEGEYREEDDEW